MPEGDGARSLKEYSTRVHIIPMDVTSCDSVQNAKATMQKTLQAKGLCKSNCTTMNHNYLMVGLCFSLSFCHFVAVAAGARQDIHS